MRRVLLFQFEVCGDLEALARKNGIPIQQVWTAWLEVWACLQGWRPDLPERIGTCPWCGSLFWRYRAQNRYCTLCGQAPKVLHGQQQAIANVLAKELEWLHDARRRSAEEFGEFDAKARRHYNDVRELLLEPMRHRIADPIQLPSSVADPSAFLIVWRFVFDGQQKVVDRVFECPGCQRIAVRRQGQKFCETPCRVAQRYRGSSRKNSARARGLS